MRQKSILGSASFKDTGVGAGTKVQDVNHVHWKLSVSINPCSLYLLVSKKTDQVTCCGKTDSEQMPR